jgi:hypothetical protein
MTLVLITAIGLANDGRSIDGHRQTGTAYGGLDGDGTLDSDPGGSADVPVHPPIQPRPMPSVLAPDEGATPDRLLVPDEKGLTDVPPQPVQPARDAPAQGGDSVRAIICAQPWPCDQAIRVAQCESSLNPSAISPDGANFGLMQVNAVHRARVGGDLSRLLDAATNVAVAYAIYLDAGGWGPWSCKP